MPKFEPGCRVAIGFGQRFGSYRRTVRTDSGPDPVKLISWKSAVTMIFRVVVIHWVIVWWVPPFTGARLRIKMDFPARIGRSKKIYPKIFLLKVVRVCFLLEYCKIQISQPTFTLTVWNGCRTLWISLLMVSTLATYLHPRGVSGSLDNFPVTIFGRTADLWLHSTKGYVLIPSIQCSQCCFIILSYSFTWLSTLPSVETSSQTAVSINHSISLGHRRAGLRCDLSGRSAVNGFLLGTLVPNKMLWPSTTFASTRNKRTINVPSCINRFDSVKLTIVNFN